MRNADRDNTVRQRWLQKAAALQSLREQARALAVMPNDLDQITTARFIVRPFVRFPVGGSSYRIDNQCSFSVAARSCAAPLSVLFPKSARR